MREYVINNYSPKDFQASFLDQIREDARQSPSNTCYILPPKHIFTQPDELRGHLIAVVPLLGRTSRTLDTSCPNIHAEVHREPDGPLTACLMLADDEVALNLLAVHYSNVCLHEELQVLWLFDDKAVLSTYYISPEAHETMYAAEAVQYVAKHNLAELSCAGEPSGRPGSFIAIFHLVDLTEEHDLELRGLLPAKSNSSTFAATRRTGVEGSPILQDAGIRLG